MDMIVAAVFAALAAANPAPPAAEVAATGLAAGLIELETQPRRIAVIEGGAGPELLLLGERGLERMRIRSKELVRTGSFRWGKESLRPLALDAAASPAGGDSLVTVVYGEDVRSVDLGIDTRLHAFILVAGADGGIRAASGDLEGWVRVSDGGILHQRRGMDGPFAGPVRRVKEVSGRYVARGEEIAWAGRWLMDATPLAGGTVALAWEDDRPTVLKLAGGARVAGGSILGDLGAIEEPAVAIRIDRPLLKGIDREGNTKDSWNPLPRRVSIATDGAAYTVERGRSRRLLGKTSGQDSVVRLDWSGDALAVARPYPGVDAFVLDFALVDRPDRRPAVLLLVNEREDGSGRAHLLLQEPRP